VDTLTPRQAEVLRLRCAGLTGVQIGERLFICSTTVKNHLTAAYERMGIDRGVPGHPAVPVAKEAVACYWLGWTDARAGGNPGP
jgi:DNA-binding NarL/FixJ family response regulator